MSDEDIELQSRLSLDESTNDLLTDGNRDFSSDEETFGNFADSISLLPLTRKVQNRMVMHISPIVGLYFIVSVVIWIVNWIGTGIGSFVYSDASVRLISKCGTMKTVCPVSWNNLADVYVIISSLFVFSNLMELFAQFLTIFWLIHIYVQTLPSIKWFESKWKSWVHGEIIVFGTGLLTLFASSIILLTSFHNVYLFGSFLMLSNLLGMTISNYIMSFFDRTSIPNIDQRRYRFSIIDLLHFGAILLFLVVISIPYGNSTHLYNYRIPLVGLLVGFSFNLFVYHILWISTNRLMVTKTLLIRRLIILVVSILAILLLSVVSMAIFISF